MSEVAMQSAPVEPPERRYRDLFGARSVVGAIAVLGVLCLFGFGIHAIDQAVKESSGFATGTAYKVSQTTSFTPAPGWVVDIEGTIPGQVVTAHKNGWELKVLGALRVAPGLTFDGLVKVFHDSDGQNKAFTQVTDVESFTTTGGQTGATWSAHGPTDAAQQWDVLAGKNIGQIRASGSAATLDSVQAELDAMAESMVVSEAAPEAGS